jgi:glycosyltransferase involved in cell wall biosynthesis
MIVGDGPLREPLQNRSRALGISHKVMFLGTRSDIPDILMATDVSVLTSDREGFPNALIESMSIGVPVVMTDFKAAAELITDGTQGFIVPRNNPAALAERIQLLIRDADLRQSIGREGKNLIEQRFSPSVMVQKLIAVYDTGIKHTLSFQNNMGTVSKSVP